MSTLHQLLPRWASRWHASLLDGRSSSGLPSALHSRVEVCPPALWPSSLTFWGRARRWLDRSRWLPATRRPVNRLAQVKAEFRQSVGDQHSDEAAQLADRIERARSLRELWHLRSCVYKLLATGVDQLEAERRLAQLNRHFPQRTPRNGLPLPH